jgi:hypothetical protein
MSFRVTQGLHRRHCYELLVLASSKSGKPVSPYVAQCDTRAGLARVNPRARIHNTMTKASLFRCRGVGRGELCGRRPVCIPLAYIFWKILGVSSLVKPLHPHYRGSIRNSRIANKRPAGSVDFPRQPFALSLRRVTLLGGTVSL